MKVKTFASTDWIEVHGFDSSYFARVFATQDEAYMVVKIKDQTKFFRVDRELLALGEIGFFQRVMESAEELQINKAVGMGFLKNRK